MSSYEVGQVYTSPLVATKKSLGDTKFNALVTFMKNNYNVNVASDANIYYGPHVNGLPNVPPKGVSL